MKPDLEQLPALIRLLEDDSVVVRENVTAALRTYGDKLTWLIDTLDPPITDAERQLLETHVLPGSGWLKTRWTPLTAAPLTWDSLEELLGLLSRYIRGHGSADDVTTSLDDITLDFQDSGEPQTIFHLGAFLNHRLGLEGNRHDYYDPENCDLYSVMMNGVGMPISLALVFLLMGRRLRLRVEGCNHPGHFFAKAWHEDELYLIDCFNDWTYYSYSDLAAMDHDASQRLFASACTPCPHEDILQRVLSNLANSFRNRNQSDRAALIESLPLPEPIDA